MTSPDNQLWLQLWRERDIDFHQCEVNRFLPRFWPVSDKLPRGRVFVPLCGKSLDMLWLAEQGHEVIGVELSPVAVKAFFKENNLRPEKQRRGRFTRWSHGRISILCGDYFSLDRAVLGHIDAVYDRAALTALPEEIRKRYVAHQQIIIPAASNVFLLTIEDVEGDATGILAPQVDAEVTSLYSATFHISLAHVERVMETDPAMPDEPAKRTEYKVYQLSSKTVLP